MAEEFPHYIDFRHVYKTFDKPVLVDSNFYVDVGQTVAIIGRSGVGKSVTLGHIMGFLKPDKGRVIVAHEDVTDFNEAEMNRIRKKVTMVFQSGALFDSLTVGENILFSLEQRLNPARAAAASAGQYPGCAVAEPAIFPRNRNRPIIPNVNIRNPKPRNISEHWRPFVFYTHGRYASFCGVGRYVLCAKPRDYRCEGG